MTLGGSGGRVQPLSPDELVELAKRTTWFDIVTTGRAFGVSELVIRAKPPGTASLKPWASGCSSSASSTGFP